MSNKNWNTTNRNGNPRRGNIKGWLFAIVISGFGIFGLVSATENYSEGERIGFITKFSHKGRYWKSWEGELNLTQTGMNTSSLFDFSIDNDRESANVIAMIDSAVNNGWKVKLLYHQTYFKNWLSNRGETDYFINGIEIMDRAAISNMGRTEPASQGHIIDTVFVVLDKSEIVNKK